MDNNAVALRGRLAADAELRVFESGRRLIKFLVVAQVDYPVRRVDIVPVTLWDPSDELADDPGEMGRPISVCGSVRRRFWETGDAGEIRVEVAADKVVFPAGADAESPT